jgi:hypothetical protein
MGSTKYALFVVLLLTISLAGCTSEESSESTISLSVNHSADSGMIVESYSNGDITSTSSVIIDFDFSSTTADLELTKFGINLNDGTDSLEIDALNNSVISFEFYQHGWYNLTAYAIDEDGGQADAIISIKIDLRIEWVETNTDQPQPLVFDPEPANGGANAQMIEVNSVVENPESFDEIISGGDSVGITWNIMDEQDDVCQKKSANIENGGSGVWDTLHFNTFQVHELSITFDDNQETINVEHIVSIIY